MILTFLHSRVTQKVSPCYIQKERLHLLISLFSVKDNSILFDPKLPPKNERLLTYGMVYKRPPPEIVYLQQVGPLATRSKETL